MSKEEDYYFSRNDFELLIDFFYLFLAKIKFDFYLFLGGGSTSGAVSGGSDSPGNSGQNSQGSNAGPSGSGALHNGSVEETMFTKPPPRDGMTMQVRFCFFEFTAKNKIGNLLLWVLLTRRVRLNLWSKKDTLTSV